MSLHLTPETLEAMYRLLQTTPPFRAWKLPPAAVVEFRALNYRKEEGWYNVIGGRHVICVSTRHVKTLTNLLRVMAHEMVHLKDALEGVRTHHGSSFKRAAKRVCKHHNIDPGAFGSVGYS